MRELCAAAAVKCGELGYKPIILTDQLCSIAREAGSFLASILKTHAGDASREKLAYIAGGETVVQLTGKGLGGRNQELALAACTGIAGIPNAAVFSFGSDGTDGPTDAAGGYVDEDTLGELRGRARCLRGPERQRRLSCAKGCGRTDHDGTDRDQRQ